MRRIVLSVSIFALAVLGGAAALMAGIQVRYERMIYELADPPAAPVAIVFGAGIRADGGLSPMLRDRMNTAIALYRGGYVRKLLVSGDNRFVDYDEPGRMYDYAVAQGVPPADVVRDYAGRRTYDTCYRAGAIFGVTHALLVTGAGSLKGSSFWSAVTAGLKAQSINWLHLAIPGEPSPQMVDEGNDRIWMFSMICPDQGWMVEFILNKDIEGLVVLGLLPEGRNDR